MEDRITTRATGPVTQITTTRTTYIGAMAGRRSTVYLAAIRRHTRLGTQVPGAGPAMAAAGMVVAAANIAAVGNMVAAADTVAGVADMVEVATAVEVAVMATNDGHSASRVRENGNASNNRR